MPIADGKACESAGARNDFEIGFLIAASHVARRGEDTMAVELMRECGISTLADLKNVVGLEAFDLHPLSRSLKLSAGSAG